MDIYKEWKELEKNNFSITIKKEEIRESIQKDSKSVMSQLEKNLGIKLRWGLLFISILSGFMIHFYTKPQVFLIFGLMNSVYILSYLKFRQSYKQVTKVSRQDNNLLTSLKKNEALVTSALRYEKIIMMITLPLFSGGGYIIPKLIEGSSIIDVLSDNLKLSILIVFLILSFAGMHFFGDKMTFVGFGALLDKLRKNINRLEQMK